MALDMIMRAPTMPVAIFRRHRCPHCSGTAIRGYKTDRGNIRYYRCLSPACRFPFKAVYV